MRESAGCLLLGTAQLRLVGASEGNDLIALSLHRRQVLRSLLGLAV